MADTTRYDERRMHARHDIDRLPVRFRSERRERHDAAARDFVEGNVGDVGRGGLFVRSEHVAEPGTLVEVQLEVPQRARPVSIRGRVAWVSERAARHGRGMGIAAASPLEQAVLDHCLAAAS